MKPTYLISVDEAHKTALTSHVLESWEDEDARYVFIETHTGSNQVNGLRRTADLMIVPSLSGYYLDIGNVLKVNAYGVVLFQNRLKKTDQAYFINHLAKDNQLFPNFHPLRTWTTEKGFNGGDLDAVILRPCYGARSIGLLVMNPKQTSFESIFRVMGMMDVAETPVGGNVTDVINGFNKEISDKFKEVPGTPVWCSDGDQKPMEGCMLFLDSRFIQEYVPNISEEYRIIIGADNKPVYVLKRDREHYDNFDELKLAYARGHKVGMEHSYSSMGDAGIANNIEMEFQALLDKANFAIHSFDLFITEDGRWGVFEFSNEFGTSSVPNELTFNEIKKYLKSILNVVQ